jgi:hypothetical protein
MATETVETVPGPRPGLPSPISLAWMPRKLSAASSDSFDLIRGGRRYCRDHRPSGGQPTPLHLLSAATVGAGSVLYAWLVSRVTEARTGVARASGKSLPGPDREYRRSARPVIPSWQADGELSFECMLVLLAGWNGGSRGVAVQQLQGNGLGLTFPQWNIALPVGVRSVPRSPQVVALLLQSCDKEFSSFVRMYRARLQSAGGLARHAGIRHRPPIRVQDSSGYRGARFLLGLRMNVLREKNGYDEYQ